MLCVTGQVAIQHTNTMQCNATQCNATQYTEDLIALVSIPIYQSSFVVVQQHKCIPNLMTIQKIAIQIHSMLLIVNHNKTVNDIWFQKCISFENVGFLVQRRQKEQSDQFMKSKLNILSMCNYGEVNTEHINNAMSQQRDEFWLSWWILLMPVMSFTVDHVHCCFRVDSCIL